MTAAQSEAINRRQFLKTIGAAAAAFGLTGCVCAPCKCAAVRRPNVVFFLVDDLGWADLGYQGSSFYKTPNLDRLAASGVCFTDAYASCPVCSPSRASLMTGKYPTRLNITDWIPGDNPQNRQLLGSADLHNLPLEEVTLAETLRDAGYKTLFAGKWHLGETKEFWPEQQGFDINKGGWATGSPYGPGKYYVPYGNPRLEDGPQGEYLTDRLTDESIRFIKENKDSPFLVYLSFYAVHAPIIPCKRLIDENKARARELNCTGPASVKEHDAVTKLHQDNADYASMVQAMDENVGRLLTALDELKLTDNTIIVFTSDNGGLSTLYGPGSPTSNAPLRAGKGWCYEGGIRVPAILRVPNGKTGITCDVPITSIDYYPTILDLAGLNAGPGQHLDGVSLAPLLKGKNSLVREAIFWHYPHYHGSGWTPGAAVRAGDWKLIEFYEDNTVELYNLKDDLGEKNNLAKANPKKNKELLDMLHRWQKETGAEMPTPNPHYKKKP
ncbi:MAG: sulfatase-like hydrolase/transferase [Planctomycetales bacterium]|nr:sulfatase-like hydrolase/transferase [Planctomycetales bacterium]